MCPSHDVISSSEVPSQEILAKTLALRTYRKVILRNSYAGTDPLALPCSAVNKVGYRGTCGMGNDSVLYLCLGSHLYFQLV